MKKKWNRKFCLHAHHDLPDLSYKDLYSLDMHMIGTWVFDVNKCIKHKKQGRIHGRAGIVFVVTRAFGQEQWGQRIKKAEIRTMKSGIIPIASFEFHSFKFDRAFYCARTREREWMNEWMNGLIHPRDSFHV